MHNLPMRANDGPSHEFATQKPSYTTANKLISTLALLILGYYVVSFFDVWPSTIKRSIYELFVCFVPSPLIYAMQCGLLRLGLIGPEEAVFTRDQFGDVHAKQEAIQRIFGHPQFPLALRKVRSLSGVSKYISLSNDTGPPGLGNWDNSCYQNSVLQGLASLPAFLDFAERSLDQCERHGVSADTHRALVNLLEQLTDLGPRKATVWTPHVLKSMDSWQQQDAQEYFSRLLEAVEKEADAYIKVLKRSSVAGLECLVANSTPPAQIEADNPAANPELSSWPPEKEVGSRLLRFQPRNPIDGMTAQCLECRTCGFTEGFSFNDFNCLTLNMGLRGPSDLEDLLDEYTAPEEIEGVECENCTERPNGTPKEELAQAAEKPAKRKPVLRTKTKQITVGRLPKDLVLHINRSIFDEYGNQLKNRAAVAVPFKLHFLSRWCAPIVRNNASVEAVYELKCMVTHYGRHDNGHYIALGQRGKEWYSFNDDLVTNITEEDVLNTGNGFMLFYEAVPMQPNAQTPPSTADMAVSSETRTSDLEPDLIQSQLKNVAEWPSPDSGIYREAFTSNIASSTEGSAMSASPSSSTSSAIDESAKQQGFEGLPTQNMKTSSGIDGMPHGARSTGAPVASSLL
ncbi:hypothetical protein A1O1_08895 [Capronia coronata CBS 617.96]|uniref:ubiquitinyl hydrolase 1 n=1 Tax=Capronia coronata CBS 617.96 TaxID=1182541 RepID=W9Y7X1_9EURO|nr:uncharacterized protein A1O1_08895 [Capronia coronata CBS 617.96]EXJ78494.1 hypothetical protein A1O1_08895 [Capronia coronata CBS 617.96]